MSNKLICNTISNQAQVIIVYYIPAYEMSTHFHLLSDGLLSFILQVELLYSKQYQLREEGLKLVLSSLSESTDHSKTDILKAVSQILKKAFADKVMAVSIYNQQY